MARKPPERIIPKIGLDGFTCRSTDTIRAFPFDGTAEQAMKFIEAFEMLHIAKMKGEIVLINTLNGKPILPGEYLVVTMPGQYYVVTEEYLTAKYEACEAISL